MAALAREKGKQPAPGRQHVRDGPAGKTARMQLRHAAADMLRLHVCELDARIEREQRFDVLPVIVACARGKVPLLRQVIEKRSERLAARIGLDVRCLIRRHAQL